MRVKRGGTKGVEMSAADWCAGLGRHPAELERTDPSASYASSITSQVSALSRQSTMPAPSQNSALAASAAASP